MRKRVSTSLAILLGLTFLASAVITIVTTEPIGACLRCSKKQACPAGHCYVDCANCCYVWNGTVYCYK